MTIPATADVTIVETAGADAEVHHYVDWPAIIAGVVLASAISVVLLTFGSAIGLSFANFRTGEGVSPVWVAIAAASWLLWVEISSFMAGGYITGRLRRRIGNGTEHEVHVRDGAHGLLVWAGALVVGAILAASGIGAVANAVGSAASTATEAASNVAGGAAGAVADAADPNAYFVDAMFRRPAANGTAAAAPAATSATPAAPAADGSTPAAASAATPAATTAPATTSTTAGTTGNMEAVRAETGRILLQGAANGGVSDPDKAYLAQLVADNTGMTDEEAKARVDEVLANVEQARAKAAEAAETARKTGVLAAFLIAASFLLSAVGAYWAAMKGGQHRDEGTVFADVFGRF